MGPHCRNGLDHARRLISGKGNFCLNRGAAVGTKFHEPNSGAEFASFSIGSHIPDSDCVSG